MLLSTSRSVRPRDCRRWPRDTVRSSTFLVVLKPSYNSRWCKPVPMRGWLRQMPTPSMVSSQRSRRGILVSIPFILFPIHKARIAHIQPLGNGDAAGDSTAPMRNIMQSLPPLLSTIHEQTGMAPPSWLAQMPNGTHPAKSQITKSNGVSNGNWFGHINPTKRHSGRCSFNSLFFCSFWCGFCCCCCCCWSYTPGYPRNNLGSLVTHAFLRNPMNCFVLLWYIKIQPRSPETGK